MQRVSAATKEAWLRGRAAWPAIDVAEARYHDELEKRVATESDPEAAIARLNAGDLYLVIACASGDPVALGELERDHVPELRGALERVGFTASAIDEALQIARATLLVAGAHGPPRILEFAGRGHLRGWLRSVVTRIAFRLSKPAHRHVELHESLDVASKGDLELDYLKKTYGAPFQDAFREAFASLPVADRVLLKQRFTLHATVIDLGALHGVHPSTISRRVIDARERLVAGTRAIMMQRLRLGAPEVSSILRLIQSELDISLSTYRGPEARDVSG